MRKILLLLVACLMLAACGSVPYPTKIEAHIASYLDNCDTVEFKNNHSASFEKYMMDFLKSPENIADLVFECPEPYNTAISNGFARYDVALAFSFPDTLLNRRFRITGFSGIETTANYDRPAVRYFASDRGVLLGLFEFKDMKIEIIK